MEFTGSDDAGKLAEEMMLMHDFWGTGKKASDRKYYHYKISFSEADRVENGGLLTPELAARYAEKFIHDHWRDYQVVWGVHADGNARHIHIVVNAVNAITGEKLRTNMQGYQQEKDDCQTLCREMGLHAMDWREAVAEKHHMERTDGTPIRNDTIEESALKSKGVKLWKDELRQKIDNKIIPAYTCHDYPAVNQCRFCGGMENDAFHTDDEYSWNYNDRNCDICGEFVPAGQCHVCGDICYYCDHPRGPIDGVDHHFRITASRGWTCAWCDQSIPENHCHICEIDVEVCPYCINPEEWEEKYINGS